MFWKSSLYMSTSSLFLIPRIHTEFLVIIFDRAENRSSTLLWKTWGDCCLKSFRKADYFILITSSEKNFTLIASRKEKKHEILWKSSFGVETITFLRFFRAAYLRRGPRTIENGRLFSNSKQNIYDLNLKLQDYREEHKSYLQGVFQLVTWRFG